MLKAFSRGRIALVALILAFAVPLIHAQVTTGNISGVVSLRTDNSVLPGVTIEAVHTPTGTRYTTVSGSNGRYTIPNVRVGGPYTVTATLEGFKPAEVRNVQVPLGQTADVPVALAMATVAEAITVTATVDPVISSSHTGASSQVSTEQIQTLPTVNRSIQDFARTNPYVTIDPRDESQTTMNIAGRNNRYNNIQIDGAVNNDLFGLAATGTPGGQSSTQAISVDAIQQLQVVVSPYDVRQGGFTGGGVNIVTRSGTNAFEGSIYGTKRNRSSVGKDVPAFTNANFSGNGTTTGIESRPYASFEQSQYGFRLGGPILRDRLFFFVTGERNRKAQPDATSADASTGTTYVNSIQDAVCGGVPGCSAARFRQDLIDRYGYDPGGLGDLNKQTPSNLSFIRFDLNAGASNQLTLRNNYVSGANDIVSNRSGSQFRFPTSIYTQSNHTSSTVAQLNSVLSSTAFNEARIGHQIIKDKRETPVVFPSIEIGNANQNATLNAGTERFSGANKLDQKITEITDDFTWTRGNHTLVFGTHNELFKFANTFLSEFYGYYFYPTLDAFERQDCPKPAAGQLGCEYRISYATGGDPQRPTAFRAQQYGIYANDVWHVTNTVAVSFGLRADKPRFNDTPSFNQTVQTALNFNTAAHPAEDLVVSPRVGFNWNPGGRQQLRGGVGIFAGRAPYVWVSNVYAGTGVEQVALACRAVDGCTVPQFNKDPLNQPKLGSSGAASVDLIDPDFQFPRILRATVGYDRELFWGIIATGELLYSKTQQDIYYENLNEVQTGTSPLDGRPTYARRTNQVVDATYLTNTGKGTETVQTIQLQKSFAHNFSLMANYSHQNAKSAFDATSSRAISNWRFQHTQGDIFQPTIGRSAFEIKHRANLAATLEVPTGPLSHSFGLFYNVQSGRPYSLILGGDPNRDTNASNDLFYVPGDGNYILCPSDATAATATSPCGSRAPLEPSTLTAYLERAGIDPTKARILNKYESFEPWSRHLDFHYGLMLPVRIARTEVTADVINLLHLLDKNQGNVYFVTNQNVTPANYVGQDAATGKPIYREASTTRNASGVRSFGSLTPGRQFSISDLASRWQMRIGVRVSF